MAKDFLKQFYKSKAWQDCREAFIKQRRSIDGGLCQRCHNNLGYIVHHKEYITAINVGDPEITLDFDNLEYVCHACHDDEHLGRVTLLCAFDEKGRPIQNAIT